MACAYCHDFEKTSYPTRGRTSLFSVMIFYFLFPINDSGEKSFFFSFSFSQIQLHAGHFPASQDQVQRHSAWSCLCPLPQHSSLTVPSPPLEDTENEACLWRKDRFMERLQRNLPTKHPESSRVLGLPFPGAPPMWGCCLPPHCGLPAPRSWSWVQSKVTGYGQQMSTESKRQAMALCAK